MLGFSPERVSPRKILCLLCMLFTVLYFALGLAHFSREGFGTWFMLSCLETSARRREGYAITWRLAK